MHKDIDEIYKQLRSQQSDVDATGVWNRIEDSLDLEELWPRINNSLTRNRRKTIAWYVVIGLLIPTIPFSIWWGVRNETNSVLAYWSSHSDMRRNEVTGGELNSKSGPISKSENHITQFNETSKPEQQYGSVNTPGFTVQENDTHTGKEQISVLNDLADSESKIEPPIDQDNFQDIVKQPVSVQFSAIPVKQYCLSSHVAPGLLTNNVRTDTVDQLISPKYYFTFTAGLKTTWLLNNHTYRAYKKESFEYLERQYYPVGAVGFGFKAKKGWLLEGNLVFLDFGGQHVNYLSEGRSIQLQTRLRYGTLEIIGGRQLNKVLHPFQLNVRPSVYLGLYSSALLQSQFSSNELDANRNKSYRTADFGIISRIGFAVQVGNQMQIQTGIGLQSGIINITNAQADIPSYFDRSYNASCSAFITAQYFLK